MSARTKGILAGASAVAIAAVAAIGFASAGASAAPGDNEPGGLSLVIKEVPHDQAINGEQVSELVEYYENRH